MKNVSGNFYLPGRTECVLAEGTFFANGTFELRYGSSAVTFSLNQYEIEPQLGSLNRVLRMRDGGRFETQDHSVIKSLETSQKKNQGLCIVAWMEARWQVVLASAVAMIVFCFAFLEYAMPLIAEHVAYQVPQGMRESISMQSLKTFERLGLLESSVSEGEAYDRAIDSFDAALSIASRDLSEKYNYKLFVYKSPKIGANAFALPSGAIVATLEFIDLCQSDEEIVAVFLHEIAHVEKQHGLRSVLQDAGVFLIASIVLGDVSSIGGVLGSVPAVAMESRYSQNFEMEADTIAALQLKQGGRNPTALNDILIRLHEGTPDFDALNYLSSHPGLNTRVENVEAIKSGTRDRLESD